MIHEEEQRERESQAHGAQDGHQRQLLHRGEGEGRFLLVVVEHFGRDVLKDVRAHESEQHHGNGQRVIGQSLSLPRLQIRPGNANFTTNLITNFQKF